MSQRSLQFLLIDEFYKHKLNERIIASGIIYVLKDPRGYDFQTLNEVVKKENQLDINYVYLEHLHYRTNHIFTRNAIQDNQTILRSYLTKHTDFEK